MFIDALFAGSTVKNNNLNVSMIFRSPFHFHYLFPINRDLAEHNSADKELDGTADVNEEIDGGCVEDRCYAFMKKSSLSACEHPPSRASVYAEAGVYGWGKACKEDRMGTSTPSLERVCFLSYPLGTHAQVPLRWPLLAVAPAIPHRPFHDNSRGISQLEDSGGQ